VKDFQKIDWKMYNRPPYYQQWLCRDDTLKLATFGDKGLADVDDQALALKDQWDLEKVRGYFLDRLGKLVAESREGNDDELYRILVRLRVLLNTADGTVNNLIKVIKFFYSSEKVQIVPNYPAGLRIIHDGEGPPINFNKIIKEVIAAGVGYDTREIMDFHEFAEMADRQQIILRTGYSEFMPSFDTLTVRLRELDFYDGFEVMPVLDGSWLLDGQKTLGGITESLSIGIRTHRFLDGSWVLDGGTLLNGMVLIPVE
jgi:hypothetical protein